MTTNHQDSFVDSSTECAICLTPFSNDQNTSSEKTITLKCGHRWHLNCIKQQLQHAQPNRSRRLLFSGCQCAKCGTFCDHPDLEHLTRKTDALRSRVDGLIKEQLQIDMRNAWKDATENDKSKLMDQGRRTYAFYLCASCNEPYFGGTVECADIEEGEIPDNDRLCPQCSPLSQIVCRDALEHRGFHVWKCRYCCNPASHVCYGTVHFCDFCHDRNSQRVREQQRQRNNIMGPREKIPPLEPIPCKGGALCSYPKPEGRDSHMNGPSHRCEQVYHCAWCISTPSTRNAFEEEPGSRNLILNPSGEQGLHGWRQLNRSMSWQVEQAEVPLNESTTTNFVSSFQWCGMAQSIPLHRIVYNPPSARLEVSARIMGRTDCPSVFKMEAIVLNDQRRIIHRVETQQLSAPADYWERVSLNIEPTPGAHEIVMTVFGKDERFWQGNFGSKVAGCSVRVLCAENELGSVLRPDGIVDREAPQRPGLLFLCTNLLFPIVLILFAWLLLE